MTLPATTDTTPILTLLPGGRSASRSWWETRAARRSIVGGCPDHWWKPTAPRTSACTCDRF